ncbi:uncharacterized protein LOC123230112 [Mangifera indica]|uniref:uncharacterized protein LOC123230112 n=1 Tax=Mangifera indica TaxID=29780 RepID=UPI001CF946E3|nr:uncharacterized protein LOC123230112 [Mangifera indica]
MVSFQAPIFSDSRSKPNTEFDHLSKRKREDVLEGEETFNKRAKQTMKSIFDTDLHLETPLPLEWERCLDIQSSPIHFYNTTTHKRAHGDPRRSQEMPGSGGNNMSLDLVLNLPCNSNNKLIRHNSGSPSGEPLGDHLSIDMITREKEKSSGDHLRSFPSWLAFERDDEQEMVATACMRCHMLVMLCKSSPTCPNCKFMHPSDQSTPKLFKQKLSLLC